MIFGLNGYARSGKDAFASTLVNEFGFRRIAFGDILKHAAEALDPVIEETTLGVRHMRLSEALASYEAADWAGRWERAKLNPDVRRLLQRLGTEVGRDMLGENVWVDAAFASVSDDENIVCTDCRFESEARRIVRSGGAVVRINRPGVGPANSHSSETSLDHWAFDAVVVNDSGLAELADSAAALVARFGSAGLRVRDASLAV